MSQHLVPIDREEIKKKVELYFASKRIQINARLDGMKMNAVQSNENSTQSRFLSPSESKVKKLDPWLTKMKHKQILCPDVLKESDRITILDVVQW